MAALCQPTSPIQYIFKIKSILDRPIRNKKEYEKFKKIIEPNISYTLIKKIAEKVGIKTNKIKKEYYIELLFKFIIALKKIGKNNQRGGKTPGDDIGDDDDNDYNDDNDDNDDNIINFDDIPGFASAADQLTECEPIMKQQKNYFKEILKILLLLFAFLQLYSGTIKLYNLSKISIRRGVLKGVFPDSNSGPGIALTTQDTLSLTEPPTTLLEPPQTLLSIGSSSTTGENDNNNRVIVSQDMLGEVEYGNNQPFNLINILMSPSQFPEHIQIEFMEAMELIKTELTMISKQRGREIIIEITKRLKEEIVSRNTPEDLFTWIVAAALPYEFFVEDNMDFLMRELPREIQRHERRINHDINEQVTRISNRMSDNVLKIIKDAKRGAKLIRYGAGTLLAALMVVFPNLKRQVLNIRNRCSRRNPNQLLLENANTYYGETKNGERKNGGKKTRKRRRKKKTKMRKKKNKMKKTKRNKKRNKKLRKRKRKNTKKNKK